MFMSAFARKQQQQQQLTFAAWFIFKTAHLISDNVNEQRFAIVQTTENERAHQLSSGFLRQEMANRATSYDLKIRWATNAVSTLRHRQGSVNVNPEKCHDCQLAGGISWHTDPPTRSN